MRQILVVQANDSQHYHNVPDDNNHHLYKHNTIPDDFHDWVTVSHILIFNCIR